MHQCKEAYILHGEATTKISAVAKKQQK